MQVGAEQAVVLGLDRPQINSQSRHRTTPIRKQCDGLVDGVHFGSGHRRIKNTIGRLPWQERNLAVNGLWLGVQPPHSQLNVSFETWRKGSNMAVVNRNGLNMMRLPNACPERLCVFQHEPVTVGNRHDTRSIGRIPRDNLLIVNLVDGEFHLLGQINGVGIHETYGGQK